MRPLRYSINVTLDGCCDHAMGIPSPELHRHHGDNLARADGLILGRVTYQMMEEAWRGPAESGRMAEWMEPWMMEFARTIHGVRKYVVSNTLRSVDWNAELVRGDLASTVHRLKQEPGNGLMTGGVKLPQALAELGLIDEYELVVQPRIAGRGPSLFAGLSNPLDLQLEATHTLASGAVALRYVPLKSEREVWRMFRKKGDDAVLAKLDEAPNEYREIAKRLHAIVREEAPSLEPVVRWGLAFYVKDGEDVFYIKPDKQYLAFGFSETVNPAREEGSSMHPVAWTLTGLDSVTEQRIRTLVRQAGG